MGNLSWQRLENCEQSEQNYHLCGNPKNGFTIIELSLVILVMSIIGIYVGVNWPDNTLNLRAQADRLAGDIRYAQALASSHGQRYQVNFLSSTTYTISDSSGNVVVYAGTGTVSLSNTTMSYTATPLVFDSKGIPYSGAMPTILSGSFVITLTYTGGLTVTITISPETGRVVVQ